MYQALDWFFVVLHTGIILLNLFGWIWDKTRVANLILLSITGGSWFILGFWYGFGYCPSTDWHWQVLRQLGETGLPGSYVAYLMERVLGFRFSDEMIDGMVLVLYFVALICSLYVNIKARKRKKQ